MEVVDMAETQYRRDKVPKPTNKDARDVMFSDVEAMTTSGDMTIQEAFDTWVALIRDQQYSPEDLHDTGKNFYEYIRDAISDFDWDDQLDLENGLWEYMLYGSTDVV